MKRIKILVEGQTEESFVKNLLIPHMASKHIILTPILLTTKRVKNRDVFERGLPGRRFKGGISTYAKVKADIRNVLMDREAVITTMIDFYGLPPDFPGMDNLPNGHSLEKVHHLEECLEKDINTHRFRPYFMLHEYEALLFSNPSEIAGAFPGQNIFEPLQTIKDQFSSPEEINHGKDTHPSARILAHTAGYRKPFHGALIAQRIGLSAIRRECSHFDGWIQWMETLTID